MRVRRHAPLRRLEHHPTKRGSRLYDWILGGQDGLVNTLGLLLGVAAATADRSVVLVAGFAAALAESISMAAVAYSSAKARLDYYQIQLERERREIDEVPEEEREEVRTIYADMGFKGPALDNIVATITADRQTWLNVMMHEELRLFKDQEENPWVNAGIVGAASLLGSLVPLLPFLVLPVWTAMWASLLLTVAVLFAAGLAKARLTVGRPLRSGLEMAALGTAAALLGFLVGKLLGATIPS